MTNSLAEMRENGNPLPTVAYGYSIFHLRNMTNSLAEMRENGNPLPTVAYGYSIFRGREKLDFNKMLKEADAQMYQYKKIHKSNAAQEITGTAKIKSNE